MSMLSQSMTSVWRLSGQVSEDEAVRNVPIDRSPFTVGRRSDQALTIPSPTISGRHAEIEVQGDGLLVRDLGSTNGTFVNGVRVNDWTPLRNGDLLQFAQIVFRAGLDQPMRYSQTMQNDSADRALALIQFDKLLAERAVTPHFQPIVTMDKEVFGYEVLGRSRLFGLSDPSTMFMAASLLNMEAELSRIFRVEGVRAAAGLPGERLLFANTHPTEIDDLDLLVFSLRELREIAPTRPLVLEIHEATATNTAQMRRLRSALDDLAMGLAYDDFGAGQARLVELVDVPPDYLKFDMKLVQGIHSASTERQKMVAQLIRMAHDLGIVTLAEGIEDPLDHEVCTQIGFTCAQGYLYGKAVSVDRLLKANG